MKETELKPIEELAEEILQEYTNCYSEVDKEVLAKMIYTAGYRKQIEGEWTKHLDEWDCEYAKCSCCGEEFYDSSGEDTIDIFYKFCPNCGAKMKGGEE